MGAHLQMGLGEKEGKSGSGVQYGDGNWVYHATRQGFTSVLSLAVSLVQRLARAFLEMGVGRKWARDAMRQNLPKGQASNYRKSSL